MTTKPTLPAKVYAVVMGTTTEEFRTKHQAISRGEASGAAWVVLSPRGFEVAFGDETGKQVGSAPAAQEPKVVTVLADDLKVGQVVVGGRKKDPARRVGRVVVGRKWVTAYDAETGRDFLYVPLGTAVEVVG